MQVLLSLPPNASSCFADIEQKREPEWVASCDPPGSRLGSGGGTAHLLADAWRRTGAGSGFDSWLDASPKLVIHAGGQSRRLPAYAATGKILIPIPVFRWSTGQQLDQKLLDLQVPFYRSLLSLAPETSRVMVTSGDVLIRCNGEPPPLPTADVVCLGMWVRPEQASHHGVFFCARDGHGQLEFFLQKPSPEHIRELGTHYLFMIDIGVWLLSEKAVDVLMRKCGWRTDQEAFRNGTASHYELYAGLGLGLGACPAEPDPEVSALSSAVVPLEDGEFYHFGTSSELIRSTSSLQNLVLDQRRFTGSALREHPDMFVQNAVLADPLTEDLHTIWVENASIPARWKLTNRHVLTGVPDNDWSIHLPAGACLDMVPVGEHDWCVRWYGIDDLFSGALDAPTTSWLGEPATEWFLAHGLSLDDAGIQPNVDIQMVPLFPSVSADALDEGFLQWLVDPARMREETDHAKWRALWLASERLSAMDLGARANLQRLSRQRQVNLARVLPSMAANWRRSVFYGLDLDITARHYAATDCPLPDDRPDGSRPVMQQVHATMFRAAVLRRREDEDWVSEEQEAFRLLGEAMIDAVRQTPVLPARTNLDDQIIWGRSPVRLDLAGGWTDTPPHCLIHGGKVVNIAVELNGQPPLQAFARTIDEPVIILRSIDLGIDERVTSYEEMAGYATVGSGFSIAKAALALAGFLPEFCSERSYRDLRQQLGDFGGGIELSMLAAIPKGSGLGTSSVLAGTVLGVLGDLCGLGWDVLDVGRRVLVLEQMLTTGGGWQDQFGGLTRGLKLIETQPGLEQKPVIKWLPPHLFTDPRPKQSMLLYYTGITRVAKNILAEIVRGMFLHSQRHEAILSELAHHAEATHDVLVKGDLPGLQAMIAHSWELNQRLDSETNTPRVQTILDAVSDYVAGAKLLGAGGGGYMLILAKDADAAIRIRQILDDCPPNRNARFIDFGLSETGFQVTRS